MVDIGAPGSSHDSIVFRDSDFVSALLNKELIFPEPCLLPHSSIKMNFFAVADAAFLLHDCIIKPYAGKNLGDTKIFLTTKYRRAEEL